MLVRVVFLFPTNTKLHFCQKSKDDLFPKNAPKDDISGITEKDDINLRKDDIGILCTFMEIFLSVSIYCFPIKKKTGNLISIRLIFDFICKLYDWRYSTMKNLR